MTAALAPENVLEALHDASIRVGMAGASTVSMHLKRSVEHENFEPIIQSIYEEEESRGGAWEEIFRQIRELLEDYKGKINLQDDGESIIVFVERGATDRIVEAHEARRGSRK